ncbi:MAG: hypothetical protein HYR72_13765 [Deltaproteobacteria bacterium]|nr:hypothetical protein [Deltaproteobacteria bacterium]MBI3391157.1 hypothetical protein [Deltaproteobacteria bacterium]
MPAVILGFEEIEDRLRILRRRVNLFTAQHVGYVTASVLALAVAALVLAALRGSPLMFRITFYAGLVATFTVLIGAPLVLYQRWRDLPHVAALADERARLKDRLVTLLTARERRPPSRLAGLLLADVLALGQRWDPRAIAPRRVPHSVYVFLLALATLGSTAFIARPEPPAAHEAVALPASGSAEAAAAAQALAGGKLVGKPQAAPHPGESGQNAPQPDGSADLAPLSTQNMTGDVPAHGPGAPKLSNDGDSQTPDNPRNGELAPQLQQLIRQAFNAEAAGKPQQLAQNQSQRAESPEHRAGATKDRNPSHDDRGQPDRESKGDSKTQSDHQQSGSNDKPNGDARVNSDQAKPRDNEQLHAAQNPGSQPSSEGQNSEHGEVGPNGSNPGNLLAKQAKPGANGTAEPKTFKLTLNSFLQGMPRKTDAQPPPPHGRVTDDGFAEVARGTATLSEQQLGDDLLRKTDVPPEFEDVVRRVYSQRPES